MAYSQQPDSRHQESNPFSNQGLGSNGNNNNLGGQSGNGLSRGYSGGSYDESGESDEYERNRDTYTSEEGSADSRGRDRTDYSSKFSFLVLFICLFYNAVNYKLLEKKLINVLATSLIR